jgi:hypothetical protein
MNFKILGAIPVCILLLAGCGDSKKSLQCNIKGVGSFKIGETTTALVDSIGENLGIKVPIVRTTNDIIKADKALPWKGQDRLYELKPDTSAGVTYSRGSYCNEVRVFDLSQYTVAGIKLHDISLKFYRDTLFDFTCSYSSELEEAMDSKYGQAPTSIKKENNTCHTMDETTTKSWVNGDIEAQSIIGTFYPLDCKVLNSSRFEIINRHIFQKAEGCSHREKNALNKDKHKEL